MATITRFARAFDVTFKSFAIFAGCITVVVAMGYLVNEFTYLSKIQSPAFVDIVVLIGILCAALSGATLIALLPNSLRVRFRRIPKISTTKPVYGFGSLLAVGIGATLGSPLFILIPLNILQYEFVSLGSLVLATILSILMAKVYANMYMESKKLGFDAMGGPSFTKVACGTRSVRYFVSRLSMWIANTALAAYSKIVFLIFDVEFMPRILSDFGVVGFTSEFIVYAVAGVFVGWTVFNALFEHRYMKSIGNLQIILTTVMVVILVYQSYLFGSTGSWNFTGLFNFGSSAGGGNWAAALIINTGYLYILFFGFQEIQALERDTLPTSSIPILSWIKKGYKQEKSRYMGSVMIWSVVIAALVNIFYGISVYSLHPSYSVLAQSSIPALYLANNYLGAGQQVLTAVAFLLATVTTFVPAFLAASRHLSALAEDGFVPHSVSKLSWIFTLIAIFILAVGNQDFLVNITDFLVLISLGFITLSAIWLKSKGKIGRAGGFFSVIGKNGMLLPLVVGLSCFVAGAAIYFVSPSVAVFGSVSIAVAYLIYDILELGSIGIQLFLAVFGMTSGLVLELYPHLFPSESFFLFDWLHYSLGNTGVLSMFLIISSILLFVNFLVDIYLRKAIRTTRTSSLSLATVRQL